jgi:predicted MFS family arabinose efflux permease
MPTLFRLLVVIALIVGAVYGGMFALATYVKPNVGEISVRVPPERINRD